MFADIHFNPNRSLELRRIMYLCQTVFLPFCRRRSGLRRDGTEQKTAAEGHKTARSNNITIEIKTLRSNDRFGFNMYKSLESGMHLITGLLTNTRCADQPKAAIGASVPDLAATPPTGHDNMIKVLVRPPLTRHPCRYRQHWFPALAHELPHNGFSVANL